MIFIVEQYPLIELVNPKMRIFKCWGTVFVKDGDGQAIPIEQLKRTMPIIMAKGGIYKDTHSSRDAGKILNYTFEDKMVDGTSVPGVSLLCQNFDFTKTDHECWDDIRTGKSFGMSMAGTIKNLSKGTTATGESADMINTDDAYEFSIVRGGLPPSNPEATMQYINYMAKSGFEKSGFKINNNGGGSKMVEKKFKKQEEGAAAQGDAGQSAEESSDVVTMDMFNSLVAVVTGIKDAVEKLTGTPEIEKADGEKTEEEKKKEEMEKEGDKKDDDQTKIMAKTLGKLLDDRGFKKQGEIKKEGKFEKKDNKDETKDDTDKKDDDTKADEFKKSGIHGLTNGDQGLLGIIEG